MESASDGAHLVESTHGLLNGGVSRAVFGSVWRELVDVLNNGRYPAEVSRAGNVVAVVVEDDLSEVHKHPEVESLDVAIERPVGEFHDSVSHQACLFDRFGQSGL
jgi:hypothetical protein